MATPSKTQATSLLAWQDVATANVVFSTAQDVSTKWAASFGIRLARKSGTAFTAGWPNIRIEASTKSSGNNTWIPLFSYQPAVGASIANTTLSSGITAGDATFAVTAATNISAGDVLFVADTSAANYEICRVKSISGTTVTPEEVMVNNHANGAIVTDQAEATFPAVDLTTYGRVRVVCDNANSGQTIAVEVLMTTFDSFA